VLVSGGGSDITLNEPEDDANVRRRVPSELMQPLDPKLDTMLKEFPGLLNTGCRTVDTFMKWNMESVKELMSLDSFSECSVKQKKGQISSRKPKEDENHDHPQHHPRHNPPQYPHSQASQQLQSDGHGSGREDFAAIQALKKGPFQKKTSANLALARRLPNFINKKYK